MVEIDDGRGLVSGTYTNNNHPVDRETWLHECFPGWGSYLNKQIQNYQVPKGQVAMWWIQGASWILKTDEGGIIWIDMFTGGSGYTEISSCGVCRQSGADSTNWLNLPPVIIDPWKFEQLDACLITHVHQDHCDIYSIKAATQTTGCPFFGPKTVVKRLGEFEVPEERIREVTVGDTIQVPGATVQVLPCYDDTAIRTGGGKDLLPYEDCCVSYLVKTSAGNILFTGDTWYNDGYAYFPDFFDIDVVTTDMGYNRPGATDKMSPYDVVRLADALQCKVIIPDHYENLAHTAWDPAMLVSQFERLAAEMIPEITPCVMQLGGMYQYPRDKEMRRYRHPSGAVNVDKTRVPNYMKLAQKFEPKKK